MMTLRLVVLSALVSLVLSRRYLETDARRGKEWIVDSQSSVEGKFIELTFAVKHRNIEELKHRLIDISSPKSENYGKLLSLEDIENIVRPPAESFDAVSSYLREFGVYNISISSGFLRAHVAVRTAEKILSATYRTYMHSRLGQQTLRCEEYSLPTTVADHVDFVAPTVNFPRPLRVTYNGVDSTDLQQNTPDSLRELYGLGSTMGGKSSTRQGVTAFLHQYYSEADLQSFYNQYFPQLLGTPIAEVLGPNGKGAGVEASLDVEYMSTLGAGVRTEFWSFAGRQPNNTENEPFLDWLYVLGNTSDPPLVFSTSYGEDEASVSSEYASRMNEEFMKNSLRGISFIFASGDSGVGSAFGPCTTFTPQYPADSPYVTSVGATTSSNPEIGAQLSSGGFSNRWRRPAWQDFAVTEYLSTASYLPDPELYNSTGRGFPDVSAQGTGYVVINNGMTLPSVAGTSCSSPTFGGIVAMLNDARIGAGKSPMGFLNPFIYAHPEVFNDVTSGNNPGCGSDGFQASEGWDPITGYGTPNFPAMLKAAMLLP
mmetsp:Transcript_23920/g.35114  ORF Transcript_23920/g.35114 Transcript_23920/m.35114 type:complete len:541 (-) Transcript_23920:212-1834(-)